MMTKVGKVLVFTIAVFSIVLAALAWGIFGNQINWPGLPGAEAGTAEARGLHATKLEQIDITKKEFVRLRNRWKDEADALAALELRRTGNQKAYAAELAALDARGPVKQITYQADGRVVLDGNARPVLAPNSDLRLKDRQTLDDDFNKLGKELNATIKEVNALIKEQEELTLQLRGIPGKTIGLLALLEASERDKYNAEKELEAARQEAINGRVAVQALQQRRQQLARRVKELREYNLAQRILP